jgi:hypothetical protein
MKKLIQFSFAIFLILTLTGCNQDQTLQEYFVEKQASDSFVSLDIPSSILSLKSNASEESKKAMASIKKVNLVLYKIKKEDQKEFLMEKDQIKRILKGKKFSELMRMKKENMNIQLTYIGGEDFIDELVVFASNDDTGLLVARVLGDHMRPEDLSTLVKDIERIDTGSPVFSELKELVK